MTGVNHRPRISPTPAARAAMAAEAPLTAAEIERELWLLRQTACSPAMVGDRPLLIAKIRRLMDLRQIRTGAEGKRS